MAKKQLKKINQPKKYLQGGSNMGSVAMMRQNPYYLGQVEQDAAESKLEETRQQAMDVRQTAVQAKKDAEAQQKAALDQSVRAGATNLVQAAATDQKAGNLGKFMLKNPNLTTATSWAPIAASTAPTAASIGQVAPTVVNPIMTNAGGNAATQMVVGQAAPTVSTVGQTVTGTANVAGTANAVTGATAGAAGRVGLMGSNMSALGAAGIGIAANVGGQIIQKRADDNSAYTFTEKERRGNTGGSALASAGTGFGIGATVGSFVPVVGNVVGGLIGAGIGAGIGALKARKENKAAEEEAKRLQREQNDIAAAYQSANVNSSLTGMDTGFGLNSSTNMNNQFTNQYQVARLGGTTGIQEDRRTKKVPGGKIVPIEGTDAVEFVGRTHAQGGILIDKNTEVEGGGKNGQGETMDQVAMSNNSKQDYIFSKYLKLGGKSFAQRHKEILKGNGSQAEIQQLAAMQEKVAGRDSKQVAAYGGFHKYLDGGVKPCPDCPPGTICNPATGACVPDEETSNSYDWNATGLEGFKAGQNAATPAPSKPAGKQVSQADYDFFIREKNAKLADEQNKIAAQNGTSNAPADAVVATGKPKGWGAAGVPSPQVDVDQPAYTDPAGVKPAVNTAASITDLASLDAAWEAGQIGVGEYSAKRKELQAAAPVSNTTIANQQPTNQTNSSATTTSNAGTPPIDQEEQDWRNHWISQGYVFNAAGEREVPAGKKLVVNDDGSEQIVDDTPASGTSGTAAYTTPTGITPNGNQQTNTQTNTGTTSAAPDWDTKKKSIIDQVNSTPDMLVEPDKKAQIIEMLNSPDPKMRDQGMYIFDLYSQVQVGQTVDPKATPASGYNPTPGVAGANTGATTGPTVTYTNSKDPNAPSVAQTPEEIEAARLAAKPRLFMGASRKVDETTGNVTVDKGKPLMGVGAMAGSRLGTATGSQADLAKVTNNSYDQAWQNKADNLYTNQKDASGGGLSSSDAIKDRDKIAESNWGQKYGYKKGMTADEAKAAHGKFATDVKSLFANNPDEMMSYFQYIVDGGNPKNTGSYLGKDAEQIRGNLTKQGYIDANGQPIAGKVVNGKTLAQYLEGQATNNAVGPIHNALGSYTAERSATKIKLKEGEKKKEEIVQELPKKYEPCPPGTYRSGDGTCKDVGDVPQGTRINGSLVAGLGQLIPIGAALMNPYKIAPGIVGAPSVKGPLMPRMALNQERASAIQQNVAYKNAVLGQNAGPASLVAMQSANTKTNQQMMQIAKQEQDTNRQLAAEEGKMGMQASMFNAESQQKTQMFNKEFNQGERRYRREDILGALDSGAARIAGIVKDDRNFKAQERLATALDETGSYDRFSILEQLNREAKRKNSPYYGTTETERRRIAAAMHKELNPEGYIGMSEYNKLQEEKAKLQKERDEAEKKNQAKFGGARQYVSRLGELKGVRGTKAKL